MLGAATNMSWFSIIRVLFFIPAQSETLRKAGFYAVDQESELHPLGFPHSLWLWGHLLDPLHVTRRQDSRMVEMAEVGFLGLAWK